jgi:predicted DNA-binding transcriptional regulator AlpA
MIAMLTLENGSSLRLVDERQAAGLLCQSVRTLQKWRVTGYGPPYYKIGRSVRYAREEIEAWILQRRQRHTSE